MANHNTRQVISQTESTPDLGQCLILVTRPQPEGSETAELVRLWHGVPLLAPAMTPAPPLDSAPFTRAMANLEAYEGVLLTSAAGARAFLTALGERPPPPLFAVGPKTARILASFQPRHPPETFNGQAMATWLLDHPELSGKRPLLFPQAEEGREELVTLLERGGRKVERVVAYRMEAVKALPGEAEEAWKSGKVGAILFFSSRSARIMVELLPPPAGGWPVVAALSPVTAATLEELGITVNVIPAMATAEAMLRALAEVPGVRSRP